MCVYTVQCLAHPYCSSTSALVCETAPTEADGKAVVPIFASPASLVGGGGRCRAGGVEGAGGAFGHPTEMGST